MADVGNGGAELSSNRILGLESPSDSWYETLPSDVAVDVDPSDALLVPSSWTSASSSMDISSMSADGEDP